MQIGFSAAEKRCSEKQERNKGRTEGAAEEADGNGRGAEEVETEGGTLRGTDRAVAGDDQAHAGRQQQLVDLNANRSVNFNFLIHYFSLKFFPDFSSWYSYFSIIVKRRVLLIVSNFKDTT